MKLKAIAANQNELNFGDVSLFFSYSTLVAAHVAGEGYYRTSEHYSPTTSRHINQWLGGATAKVYTPAALEALASKAFQAVAS